MSNQIDNKLIAKNTLFLYLRMIFTLAVSLFTTRELLRVLGVDDFGLYNVVGGVVAMFSFLNSAMVASSQRFISFALGEKDSRKQTLVFSASIFIHITIGLVIVIFAESIGLWFLNNKLTIPDGRVEAVNWVYQAAIVTFCCQVLQVPFTSTVIAHERMSFYAIMSVVDSVLKLAIVYVLAILGLDRLILYSLLLMSISIFDILLYIYYTKKNFRECRFTFTLDKGLYKEMFSFAGWSFLGNFGFTAKDYGVNIILNIFCGPAVNAARGVAYQVMNAVNGFVANFQTAMNPQITKRYAVGEVESMIHLVKSGARYSFYLLSIIVIPLYIRAEYVLVLWLGEVPDLTLQFLKLTLIMAMVNSMFGPLVTAMQATGKIKLFQTVIAIIMVMDAPIAFFLMRAGYPPYTVMYVAIGTAFVGLIARSILLNRLVKIDLRDFIINVVFRNFILGILMYLFPAYISNYIPDSFFGLALFSCISVFWSGIVIYASLKRKEKQYVKSFILTKFIQESK